jgi:plastocyanin
MLNLRWMFFIFLVPVFLLGVRPGWANEDESPAVVIGIVMNSAGLCDKAYNPPEVIIPSGTKVVWVNRDLVTHSLVSGQGEDPCILNPLLPERRVIGGSLIFPGRAYSMTFDTPGTYFYTCHLPTHRMQGKIIVEP